MFLNWVLEKIYIYKNEPRNETFEKLGELGMLFNLQVYLTTVFNMKWISASTLLNVFIGTTNFATMIGAYASDTDKKLVREGTLLEAR